MLVAAWGLYYISTRPPKDPAAAEAKKAVRDHPELLRPDFDEALARFGVVVPQSEPIGAKTYEIWHAVQEVYPKAGDSLENDLKHADRAVSERQYAQAESIYRQLSERWPKAAVLRLSLAFCLMYEQKFAEAESLLREYIAQEPSDPVGLIDLGWTKVQQREYAEAAELFTRSVRLDSSQVVGFLSLSRALLNLGRFEDAKRALDPVVAAKDRLSGGIMSVVELSLGAIYAAQDSLEQAADRFREATAYDTNNAFAYYNLGVALGQLHELKPCIEAFDRAVQLMPTQTHWRYLLGRAYYADGQSDRAYIELNKALKQDPGYFVDSFFTKR